MRRTWAAGKEILVKEVGGIWMESLGDVILTSKNNSTSKENTTKTSGTN